MTAEIIQFVPRPNTQRPTLLEGKEIEAEEFLERAPALSDWSREREKLEALSKVIVPDECLVDVEILPKYLSPDKDLA